MLSQQTFVKLVEKQAIAQEVDTDIVTFAGPQAVRQGKLSGVKVGDFENREIRVIGGDDKSSVGIGYFRRFLVTFDFAHDQMYLAKGAAFDAPDLPPAAGLVMKRIDGRTMVAELDRGGPAEKAGMTAEDQLLTIGGEPVAGKPFAEIGWLFREKADANGKVKVTYLRNNEEKSTKLTFREYCTSHENEKAGDMPQTFYPTAPQTKEGRKGVQKSALLFEH